MRFDVLHDPWIPVADSAGRVREMGVCDVLLHAHELAGVTSANAMVEYGIQRMLCAFVMDMLRTDELEDEGRFDPQALQDYEQACREEGVSFDLFDPARPFMQCPFDARWDSEKNVKPVREIDYTIPSGNNHMLFDHLTAPQQMTPAEAIRQLCAVYTFCTAGLKGPSGVNGAPPLFVLIRGASLYETLLFSCVPEERLKWPYADPPVYWRFRGEVKPEEKVAGTSVLLGMTFPSRRITLIPEADGMVRRVYYQKGLDFQGYEGWVDPHVAYMFGKKGRSSIKPQLEKDAWRSAGTLLDCAPAAGEQRGAPVIVQDYRENTGRRSISLMVYGTSTSNASYLGMLRSDLAYDVRLMDHSVKIRCVQDAIRWIEQTAALLGKAIRRTHEDETHLEGAAAQAVEQFYAWGEGQFHGALCPRLSQWDGETPGVAAQALEDWKKAVCGKAMDVYDESVAALTRTGRGLLNQQTQRRNLAIQLRKQMKEG